VGATSKIADQVSDRAGQVSDHAGRISRSEIVGKNGVSSIDAGHRVSGRDAEPLSQATSL
jgi:hypothetical protein